MTVAHGDCSFVPKDDAELTVYSSDDSFMVRVLGCDSEDHDED